MTRTLSQSAQILRNSTQNPRSIFAEPGKGAIHGAKDLRHGDVYLRLGLIAEAPAQDGVTETKPVPAASSRSTSFAKSERERVSRSTAGRLSSWLSARHKTIKEIEQRLGDPLVRLHSFIVSNTPSTTMRMLWHMEKSEMQKRHVLFQEEDKDSYVGTMLQG